MKLASHAFLLLALLLTLTACSKEPLYQEESFVFGTRVEVSVYGEEEQHARLAVTAVMHEFQRLHNMLHAWKPSALSEINAAFSHGKPVSIGAELQSILHDAALLSAQSDDIFNPAIGGMVKLWGFHADEFKPALPDKSRLAKLLAAKPRMGDISFKKLQGNKTGLWEISSANPAVSLDLGGYAKGVALDRAALLLKQQGISNALINIGGNVLALGTHGSRAWRVGIQHPRKPGPLATLELHDGEAIGTSGDYQRYFELGGLRYCHLIDPRNGQPAQGTQAVTVLTHGDRAGVLSDATSKPIFMSGKNAWHAMARQMRIEKALLVDSEGIVHITADMQKRLEFTDANMIKLSVQ